MEIPISYAGDAESWNDVDFPSYSHCDLRVYWGESGGTNDPDPGGVSVRVHDSDGHGCDSVYDGVRRL